MSFSSKRIPPKPLLLDGKRRRQRKHQNIIIGNKCEDFSPSNIAFGNTFTTRWRQSRREKSDDDKVDFFDRRVGAEEGCIGPALRATRDDGDDVPFGYTRLDAILIGGGGDWFGISRAYYGLQEFAGFDAQWAGNVVQLTFVLLLTLLWVGSYARECLIKHTTYGKQ